MHMNARKIVVVTGVSSGIGFACVDKLINEGYFVFGSVRRAEDASRLSILYGNNFEPLFFDLVDDDAIDAAADIVSTRLGRRTLAGLINNAGAGFPGPLLHISMEHFRQQIAINLTGQLKVIQAFAPLLGASDEKRIGPPGRIVNMSSLSGRFSYPFLGAYCASKFALEAISDALRRELIVYGVDVVIIQPGIIKTQIYDEIETHGVSDIEKTIYAKSANSMRVWALKKLQTALPPARVADAVVSALVARSAPTRIIVEKKWFLNYFLPPILPARLSDWLIAFWLGFHQIRSKRTKE